MNSLISIDYIGNSKTCLRRKNKLHSKTYTLTLSSLINAYPIYLLISKKKKIYIQQAYLYVGNQKYRIIFALLAPVILSQSPFNHEILKLYTYLNLKILFKLYLDH